MIRMIIKTILMIMILIMTIIVGVVIIHNQFVSPANLPEASVSCRSVGRYLCDPVHPP